MSHVGKAGKLMEKVLQKKVTASDVARRAGVSQSAVSLALRGSSEVSRALTERIRRLAQQMNYYPNAGGQLLRSRRGGKAGQLGLIVASQDSAEAFAGPFMGRLIGQFVRSCAASNIRYAIEFHHHNDDAEGFVPPHHAAAGLCDGSIAVGDVGSALRQWLDAQAGYPWVSVYEPAEYCVLSQDDEAMYQTVARLVELGHRRIACNVGPQRYLTHQLRLQGMQRARRDFNLDIPAEWMQVFPMTTTRKITESSYAWARTQLSRSDRPTAMILSGGIQAVALAIAKLGLEAPRDLSLIATLTVDEAANMVPNFAVVDVDLERMAGLALELLQARISGSQAIAKKVLWVTPQFISGDSVGPAPRN